MGCGWVEGTSVQFEKTGAYDGFRFNRFNFLIREGFSCPFGLRKEEGFSWSTEQVSNVMLSLGDENGSTMQIGTKGKAINFLHGYCGSQSKGIAWIWSKYKENGITFWFPMMKMQPTIMN